MPFQQDAGYEDEFYKVYGTYYSTFRSQTGQVLAQLFQQGDRLVAHVSFPTGIKPEDVTDPYAGELNRYANEQGFEKRLRMIFSEQQNN